MSSIVAIQSAVYANKAAGLVRIIFNDGSIFSIYENDGSPRIYAHDLLDEWIQAGNSIADESA